MELAVGLRHHEAETHGFVHKGHFPKIAPMTSLKSDLPRSLVGRAPLARWNASARPAPGFAHVLNWSPDKRKGASRKACAKLDLYF
jgi:hypothetical protein